MSIQHQIMHLRSFAPALCVLVAGCGGAPDHGLNLAPVSGTVTFNGEPLADAAVSFAPEDGGRLASGKTDENGRFELTTVKDFDGAIVGRHRVRVEKRVRAQAPHLPARDVGKPLIPEKYFDASTSGLTAEVVDGESNVCDFALTGDPKSANQQAAQSR